MSGFVKCQLDCRQCQTIALSVFSTLKPEELGALNQHKLSMEVQKGDVIFYENSVPTGFYCVHKGKVKIYSTADSGDVQIVRLATDGNILGYRSLLANEPYQSTAEAIEESIVCFIPKDAMMNLLARNLDFSLKIMESFAQELDQARKKSLDILFKTSKERLAEAIILLRETFGEDSKGFIKVKLTRAEMAAITGMVHETVVRILAEWEREGVLQLEKKLIRITNPTQLLQYAAVED